MKCNYILILSRLNIFVKSLLFCVFVFIFIPLSLFRVLCACVCVNFIKNNIDLACSHTQKGVSVRLESDRHKNKLLNLKCDFVFQVFFAPPQESEDVVIHCLLPSAFWYSPITLVYHFHAKHPVTHLWSGIMSSCCLCLRF